MRGGVSPTDYSITEEYAPVSRLQMRRGEWQERAEKVEKASPTKN